MHTTARHFIDGLLESGIDYLFSNLGTDHVNRDVFMRAQHHLGRCASFELSLCQFVHQRHMVGAEVAEQPVDAHLLQAVDEVACRRHECTGAG